MPLFMNKFWLKMEEANPDEGKGGGGGGSGDPANKNQKPDEKSKENPFSDLDEANKEIKRLRAESADRRTKNKTLEESITSLSEKLGKINTHLGIKDDVDPAEQLQGLTAQNEQLSIEISLQQLARTQQIPVEHDEYFRFLIGKKFEALKEGEELSDEAINEVVAEVKKYSGFKGNKSTGLSGGQAPAKNGEGGKGDEVTAEQFKKMSLVDKSKLFEENKELYLKLQKATR